MPAIDRLACQLRRRIVVGEFLRLAGRPLAISLLLLGFAILAVKLFAPDFWPRILWLAISIPIVGGWLLHRARQIAPSGWRLISLLDDRLAAGGLLMTLAERPDPRWEGRLPEIDRGRDMIPALIPEPFARALVVPVMFLGGALALPSQDALPPPPRATLADDVSTELETALSVLQGNEAIDPATAALLAREIGQLATSLNTGSLTQESWETVDALRGQMRSVLDSRDQSLLRGELALSALMSSVEGGKSPSSEDLARLGRQLGEAVRFLEDHGVSETRIPEQAATSEGLRQILDEPATRKLALNAMRTLLSKERGELESARQRLAEVLGEPQLPAAEPRWPRVDFARSPFDVPTTSTVRAVTGAADDWNKTLSEGASSLRSALLPIDFLEALTPGWNVLSATADADKTSPAAPTTEGNAAITMEEAVLTETDSPKVPVTTFSQSPTWKRELRPRHRDVVQEYFRGGE